MHLTPSFLEPFRRKGDPFPDLIARATFLGHYCREEDHGEWTNTIARCVEGSCALDPSVTREEAEKLFAVFWTMKALPPGRGIWTGGVPGIPADARFNCHFTTLYGVDDWCWTADQLMLGGGVGVGLSSLASFPDVTRGDPELVFTCSPLHKDAAELWPLASNLLGTPIEDSRSGWVEALRQTLRAAFSGSSLWLDFSLVRARGTPIKTFGGTACGPGPLGLMLRSVWNVVRGAQGRKLRSVEALDITNFIGRCIKAGNVRRSALIVLGEPHDYDFRNAKQSHDARLSHRHTSNNSMVFRQWSDFQDFDWLQMAKDNVLYGDPGLLNLALIRQTDKTAEGVNPCAEIPLAHREACNLSEVFPARFDRQTDATEVFRLVTRYTLRQRLITVSDPQADRVGRANMRLGVGLGGLCDFMWTAPLLRSWFETVRGEANHYASELGVNRPVAVTTVKPSGTISLLSGSNPGIHAAESSFYLRRMRWLADSTMAHALREAGVPCETDVTDPRVLVFAFPKAAKNTRWTADTQTIREQFERQLTVQEAWADNAVSHTVTYAPGEVRELADCLQEFAPKLKSVSCISLAHGYAQPPYQPISGPEFSRLHATIDHEHRLTRGAGPMLDECAGGACPVK